MNHPLHDLANNAGGGVSILPGSSALSGTTPSNGTGIDCQQLEGPIQGEFSLGTVTGTPDSFAIACKLQESDSSGSGYADISSQSTLSLTSSGSRGFVRGIRTKRYVRCVATPAFVNGTSPTMPVAAGVIGQKRSY